MTIALSKPKNFPKMISELTEQREELLAEAESIHQKCEVENREPTAEESKRFNAITAEEAPRLMREISLATARMTERKELAQARQREKARSTGGTSDRLTFRDASTGRLVTALEPDEKLTPRSMADNFNGAQIEEGADLSGVEDVAAESIPTIGEIVVSKMTGRSLQDVANRPVSIAFEGGDDSGGYLVPEQLGSMVIDAARAASVSVRAGARTIPVSSPEYHVVRVDKDPEGHWRSEKGAIKATEMSFGRITLRPKMLAAIVPISIELLEDASNASEIITSSVGSALGVTLDQAVLNGTGAENQPRGITNHSGVNTVTGVGTPSGYAEITAAVGKIMRANYPGGPDLLSWITNPRDAETYDGLVDSTGQPLRPTPWAETLKRFNTTSMPDDGGAGSNESEGIVGDFRQVLLGVRTSLQMRILEAGQVTDSAGSVHSAAEQFLKLLVFHMRVDVAVLRPSWFTVLSGITAT